MCATGGPCTAYAPGHALHLIQARLASATPREWVDVIVESVDEGEISLRTWDDERVVVWNAGSASAGLTPGLPVALHRRYAVLAVGRRSHNVAILG